MIFTWVLLPVNLIKSHFIKITGNCIKLTYWNRKWLVTMSCILNRYVRSSANFIDKVGLRHRWKQRGLDIETAPNLAKKMESKFGLQLAAMIEMDMIEEKLGN